jgi:hypothetical protein
VTVVKAAQKLNNVRLKSVTDLHCPFLTQSLHSRLTAISASTLLKAPSDLLFHDAVQNLPQFILNFNIPLYSIPETGRNCKKKEPSRRHLPLLARICTKQFGFISGRPSAEGSHILQQSG